MARALEAPGSVGTAGAGEWRLIGVASQRPPIGAVSGGLRESRRLSWLAPFLAALGPGVIGLCADNDAGGMLSYLVTGASHGLNWILPALVLLGVPTLFIQWLALRIAQATRLPYSKALRRSVGKPLTLIEGVVLYGLNTLILVTEFVGMTLPLSMAGVPLPASLAVTFMLVVALTSSRVYPRIEHLLLRIAALNLVFVPALLLVHRARGAVAAAFVGHIPNPWFLLLALAGNSIAPWMIYWQQNAVCAGESRTPRQQAWDLTTGVIAMIVMASVVLLLGALAPGNPTAATSPLAWLYQDGGHVSGVLFAVGIFDAGLLAACAVSLSSLWTLREAVGGGAQEPTEAPNRGRWLGVHLATLAVAAAVVLWPHLALGSLALWAQALAAVWMPVSLVLLGVVASSRRVMGQMAITRLTQVALGAVTAAFVFMTYVGLRG